MIFPSATASSKKKADYRAGYFWRAAVI